MLAVTVNVCASSAAPELMPLKLIVCGPASSTMNLSGMASSVGGSLTGLIVTVKVRVAILLDAPPSLTLTVTRAVPLAFVTVLKVSVPPELGLL